MALQSLQFSLFLLRTFHKNKRRLRVIQAETFGNLTFRRIIVPWLDRKIQTRPRPWRCLLQRHWLLADLSSHGSTNNPFTMKLINQLPSALFLGRKGIIVVDLDVS